MTEHWFDRLSQELAGHTSRRQSLRLGALLATGLALGGAADVTAGKKKQQKKDKKHKKDKKDKKPAPPPPPPRPDHMGEPTGDDCEAFFGADDPQFLDQCHQLQQQCQAP